MAASVRFASSSGGYEAVTARIRNCWHTFLCCGSRPAGHSGDARKARQKDLQRWMATWCVGGCGARSMGLAMGARGGKTARTGIDTLPPRPCLEQPKSKRLPCPAPLYGPRSLVGQQLGQLWPPCRRELHHRLHHVQAQRVRVGPLEYLNVAAACQVFGLRGRAGERDRAALWRQAGTAGTA